MAITTKIRGNTMIIAGTITNAEINASAAIVESKIAFTNSGGHNHDGSNSTALASTAITSHFVYNEIPTGTINSSNTLFTLANTPSDSAGIDCSLDLWLNGVHLQPGTSSTHNDYFISASAIVTTTFAPTTGDIILASYMK
jgi:hypothetical protein